MKYIRTKDGIYELEHDGWLTKRTKPKHIEMLVAVDNKHYEMRKIIHIREIGKSHWKTEIVKKADTIEELCDCFISLSIYEGKVVDFDICRFWEDWHDVFGEEIAEGNSIYGAIWTDKGLIYVAKMNDKGELELL